MTWKGTLKATIIKQYNQPSTLLQNTVDFANCLAMILRPYGVWLKIAPTDSEGKDRFSRGAHMASRAKPIS
jgi:hypothetical protein